jgi:hypothetical protein
MISFGWKFVIKIKKLFQHESLKIPDLFSDDCEFDGLICNENYLGQGTTRKVYKVNGCCSEKVIKISLGSSNVSNWNEYIIYQMSEYKKVLGEIFSISYSGKYLIMEYLPDTDPQDRNSIDIPSWWTDRKPENFGISKDGVKLRDYANFKINQNLEKYSSLSESQHDIKESLKILSRIGNMAG